VFGFSRDKKLALPGIQAANELVNIFDRLGHDSSPQYVTENCQSGFMTSRNIRFSRIYESPCKLEAFKSAMAQL